MADKFNHSQVLTPGELDKFLSKDLPDEMFEDMLHSLVRNTNHVPSDQRMGYLAKGYDCKDPVKCITHSPHYTHDCRAKIANVKTPVPFMTAKEIVETQPMSGPVAEENYKKLMGMFIPPCAIPVDEWDDDDITEPFGAPLSTREKWKKEGLCPECGDKSRESCVGICIDHGKFMG